MNSNHYSFLLICLFCLILNAHADDTFELKYKMKKGAILNYSSIAKSETIQEVMGAEQGGETEFRANVKIVATGTDDHGNLTFVLTNESLEISVYTVLMDSTFTDPPGMTGKRIEKTLAPNGDQLQSVELDTLEVLDVTPGYSSEQEFLPNLPDKAVQMGQTVSVSDVDSTQTFSGTTIINSTIEYNLAGNASKFGYACLKINIKGTIRLKGDGTVQGLQFFLEGDGIVAGTIYFAPEEGLLVSSENQTELEMTAAVTGQQNMIIPITQSSTSSLTLVK